MHVIDQIQLHPRPPISLDKKQVESLTEKVTYLQEFLESYPHVCYMSEEADGLESRMADAAYAAEDVIESHIVDQILAKSTYHGEGISSIDFYQNLQKVIEDMDSIKKRVAEIKEKNEVQDKLQGNSKRVGSSSGRQNSTMVGCDDVLLEIMGKLTGGQLDRQIIPIVGMGGMGKTTLARNSYAKPLIKEHFDICAWATISQEYNTREILNEVLSQVYKEGRGYESEISENELGEILYKYLTGRRYMIVMDDMWGIEVWDNIKTFFPSNDNGSQIVITTRLSNLASQLTSSNGLRMKFLDEVSSWNLFSKIVFKEEGCCPVELEETGRQIVKSCKGLPLSIVVIGGLLEKSEHKREYWEHIAENLNSTVNSEDNERCLQILQMSYKQLPVYLKPCFLYMGVFSEDSMIRVSTLVKLWVAEGFLKPISGKSLKEIAKNCLEELIDRNLILVHKLWSTGNIKYCKIHDLLRDLCLREAQKERIYNVTSKYSLNLPHGINTQRRIVIPKSTLEQQVLDPLLSMSSARSLICDAEGDLPLHNFGLLRILNSYDTTTIPDYIFHLVNLQYLAIKIDQQIIDVFPFSLHLLWNLHTLIVQGWLSVPDDIWNMPKLRHVQFKGLYLPNPPSCNGHDDIVLENLETLVTIVNFKCDAEVVRRIPNVKKLKLFYGPMVEGRTRCLHNLERLQKLESFACSSYSSENNFLPSVTFPQSLKKLTIESAHVYWDDMLEKIGSLPLLEKLQLEQGCFKECKWETVEGQFRSLKFLLIEGGSNLESWTTESSHFPRLEHLVLTYLFKLNEIPSEIGEIPTLKSIVLRYCSESAIISAKKILEEQEELNGDQAALQVKVILTEEQRVLGLKSFASPNFLVEYISDD